MSLTRYFKGYWSSGNRSGHGVMFYSDNTNYMGRWVNDKRSGYGVLRNNLEGWRFLSLWKEDKKHGRGIFIRPVNKMMLKRQPTITTPK